MTYHSELMLTKRVKDMYRQMLSVDTDSPTAVQQLCQVVRNIYMYLVEEERKMMKAEAECENKLYLSNFLLSLCQFLFEVSRNVESRFFYRTPCPGFKN